jgi:hypothetical protein
MSTVLFSAQRPGSRVCPALGILAAFAAMRYVLQIRRLHERVLPVDGNVSSVRKVLMIYNFHWTYYEAIHAIKDIYLPFFIRHFRFDVDVVFYGPAANSFLGIDTNGLPPGGWYSYVTLSSAAAKYRGPYLGYLLLNDDSILNPLLLNHHDFSRVLTIQPWGLRMRGEGGDWPWSRKLNHDGKRFFQAAREMFAELCSVDPSSAMCRLANGPICGFADFFYIPAQYVFEYSKLTRYCAKHQVFLETCVPSVCAGFNPVTFPHCDGSLEGGIWNDFGRTMSCVHMHPLKLSRRNSVEKLQEWIRFIDRVGLNTSYVDPGKIFSVA